MIMAKIIFPFVWPAVMGILFVPVLTNGESKEIVIKPVGKIILKENSVVRPLGRPADFCFTDDGKIVVADAQAGQVIIGDENGRVLSIIGRRGQGPGEFDDPMRIALGPDGLLVYESGSNRLQVLTMNGVAVYSHAVIAPVAALIGELWLNPDGSCLFGTMGFGKSHLMEMKNRSDSEIGRYGTVFGKAWAGPTDFGREETKRGIVSDFYKNIVIPLQDDEGCVYGVHMALPLIRKFQKSGELLWSKEIVVPEMKIIMAGWKEQNRKAPANITYRLGYWRDARVMKNGNLLLLSDIRDEMIIYEINGKGEIAGKFKSGKADISMIRIFRDILWAYDSEEQAFYKFELGNPS
jgi:hypothetical protein